MGHWIPTGIEPTDYDDELGPKLCLKANTQNAIEKIRNIMISHKEGHMTIKNHQNVSIPKTHALTFQFMLQSSVAVLQPCFANNQIIIIIIIITTTTIIIIIIIV